MATISGELARLFIKQEGEKYLDCDEKTRHDALAKFGLDHNIPKMKTDLSRAASVRRMVLRVHPPRKRLCGRLREGADPAGLYL